eukprot:TRINITY_DN20130_c0_g1_i1.p1 TRINITY_DN20130_c0_g1~~TRINITY_DN20130_c0_g1_i1.p1  ORF type:complete len:484 (+),score=83.88 TRINITY_DN20130_c0_g1_i1:133-1584(+)
MVRAGFRATKQVSMIGVSPIVVQIDGTAMQEVEHPTDERQAIQMDFAGWKGALRLWLISCRNSSPVLISVLCFLLPYYLPARLLSKEKSANIDDVLYNQARMHLSTLFAMLSFSSTLGMVYGFQQTKRLLLFIHFPIGVVCTIFNILFRDGSGLGGRLFLNIVTIMGPILSLALTRRIKHPERPTQEDKILWGMTRDGSPVSLIKCLLLLFVTILALQHTIPLYIHLKFYYQIIFRGVVFPTLIFVVSMYWQVTNVNLPNAGLERRFHLLYTTESFTHFFGYMIISTSKDTRGPLEFLAIVGISATVDFIARITYIGRYRALRRQTNNIVNHIRSKSRVQNESLNYTPSSQDQNAEDLQSSQIITPTIIEYRCRSIILKMESDFHSIFLAPFMFYFLHPIFARTNFATISDEASLAFQISVQLTFKFFFDILACYYEAKSQKLPVHNYVRKKTTTEMVHGFITYCFIAFYIQGILIQNSDTKE